MFLALGGDLIDSYMHIDGFVSLAHQDGGRRIAQFIVANVCRLTIAYHPSDIPHSGIGKHISYPTLLYMGECCVLYFHQPGSQRMQRI